MTFAWEPIRVAYRLIDGNHAFYSADLRVLIAHSDRAEAVAQMIRRGKELLDRRAAPLIYVLAYDRLGPQLKILREGGGFGIIVKHDVPERPPPSPAEATPIELIRRLLDLNPAVAAMVREKLAASPRLGRFSQKDPTPRAEVTFGDFLERLPDLDPEAMATALSRIAAAPPLTCLFPGDPTPEPPPPLYVSWSDYLARTTRAERLDWCTRKAKKANQQRLLSDAPAIRLTREDVWNVMAKARGRCAYCGSLAVEYRPSDPQTGAPITWALVGRRIGSLGHTQARFFGGGNEASNLNWSCLWCNTWVSERRRGATDHGGFHPKED